MDQIIAKLLEHGIPGIAIAYLLWKNWDQEKRMRSLEDARHQETKDYLNAFSSMTSVLEVFQAEIRGKLESLKDAVLSRKRDE